MPTYLALNGTFLIIKDVFLTDWLPFLDTFIEVCCSTPCCDEVTQCNSIASPINCHHL